MRHLMDAQWHLIIRFAQFDVAVRKLLLQLQARRQRFYKDGMFRFRYPVDFDDVTFGSRVIGEFGFHENLPSFAPTADLFKHEFDERFE